MIFPGNLSRKWQKHQYASLIKKNWKHLSFRMLVLKEYFAPTAILMTVFQK